MKLAIAAIVKNERESLPEWMAFHLSVGVSHFLIADNESDDGTYEWLAPMQKAGLVTLLSVPTEGQPPQLQAYRQLLHHCPQLIDLLAFIDVDEFLLPTTETLEDDEYPLLSWLKTRFSDPEVSALGLNWACFGSAGARFREDGLVIERFTRRARQDFGPNHHIKSVVRPRDVECFINPHIARLRHGHYLNSHGAPLIARQGPNGSVSQGLSDTVCWDGARINHYLVKSVEEFVLGKAQRGSAATPHYQKQRDYFMRHDRNDVECHVAAQFAPKVKQKMKWLQQLADKQHDVTENADERSAGQDLKRWLTRRVKEWTHATPEHERTPIERWSLDYPSPQRGSRFLPSGRVVQGWLLLPEHLQDMRAQVRIVARWLPVYELCYPLDIERPDVIENVLSVAAEGHAQQRCGFRFTVPPLLREFSLWLALGDERWLLQDVHVDTQDVAPSQPLKVLEGKKGWLFLDNDTNGSVDQFTGRMQLTQAGVEGWQAYLRQLSEVAGQVPCALLVAPSKESVMGEQYHPQQGGETGPMQQVLALPEAAELVYPVAALKSLGDGAFIPTDTHWTHQGAMTATLAFAERLGLDASSCASVFAKDRYKKRTMGGDLGNKLAPKQTSVVEVLTSFTHTRYKTYDNGLPNFGRLMVMEYPKALMSGTCLLFGSSSSYSMFNYLCRLFQRVVFVHSAGNVDPALVQAVSPAYLAAQTNARFVIQVPTVAYSLQEMVQSKSSQLDEKALEGVLERRIIAEDEYLQTVGILPWAQAARALIS
ncbi:glycosyltransferase family 2 protein [Halomonas sp. C22]|uniref:glycosyltransferase family 2 protein n=1 Tax=Halomonas sp. C22 TaxID=2580567 RepID=UPI00119FB199|nr:glycosyltransferase family 2 protein [Halomonas sp. C22]